LFHRLALTHDLQRTTRFTYWRCRNDHGSSSPFITFCAKKISSLSFSGRVRKLRATVRQIACSQCGAPVDLANATACTHCGAPIALIDPDGVAKALHDLAAGASSAAPSDPGPIRDRLSDAQIDAIFDLARMRQDEGNGDIVAIGATAIGALIAGLLTRDSDTATAPLDRRTSAQGSALTRHEGA
jgi:hypothetical protein